jgi:hypothetical protein
MAHNPWALAPGLNNVGSYQVSGQPFVSGSCLVPASGSASLVVRFPSVTKWLQLEPVNGTAGQNIRVAFSENGLHGKGGAGGGPGVLPGDGYCFHVHVSGTLSRPLDFKVSEVWLMSEDGSTAKVDILAGLTSVPQARTSTDQQTINGVVEAGGPNWSGSIGVG